MKSQMKRFEDTNFYVTEDGNVYIAKENGDLILATKYLMKSGKEQVSTRVNGKLKCYAVDSLVMRTFGDVPNRKKLRLRHINGDLLDNRLCNLEFVGSKEDVVDSDEINETTTTSEIDSLKEDIIDLKNRLTALNEWSKYKTQDLEERVTANKDRIDNWARITADVNSARQEEIGALNSRIDELDKKKKNRLFR